MSKNMATRMTMSDGSVYCNLCAVVKEGREKCVCVCVWGGGGGGGAWIVFY